MLAFQTTDAASLDYLLLPLQSGGDNKYNFEKTMIFEIADFEIDPAEAEGFQASVAAAVPLFQQAKGYRSFKLTRSIEEPQHYQLVIGWDSVAAHMQDFRNSPGYQQWRELVGGYFKSPPKVEHVQTVLEVDV